jgi:hypothetical protein
MFICPTRIRLQILAAKLPPGELVSPASDNLKLKMLWEPLPENPGGLPPRTFRRKGPAGFFAPPA